MASLFTYSPKQVTLSVGGYTITGWETLSLARSTQGFVPIRGIRGKNTRVKNLDTSATLTVSVLQTSMANDVFSRIHELDLENGTGRLEITLKDLSGTGVFSSAEVFVVGYPQVIYSGNFEYRQWQLFALSTTTYTVGGNGKSNNIFDSILDSANNIINKVSNIF